MNEILEKIKAYELILIHRHKNPDPDAIGSQAGLEQFWEKISKKEFMQLVMTNQP